MYSTENNINSFTGKNRWLSNFWPATVMYEGDFYPTVENAYVAAKTLDKASRIPLFKMDPSDAKKYGKQLKLRSNWSEIRVFVMADFLWQKFNQPDLKQQLIDTGDVLLIEGNNWNDRFWGVDGTGKNVLGKLLMAIRQYHQTIVELGKIQSTFDLTNNHGFSKKELVVYSSGSNVGKSVVPHRETTWDEIFNYGCAGCDIDEADGGIIDHCQDCCVALAQAAIKENRPIECGLAALLKQRTGLKVP